MIRGCDAEFFFSSRIFLSGALINNPLETIISGNPIVSRGLIFSYHNLELICEISKRINDGFYLYVEVKC